MSLKENALAALLSLYAANRMAMDEASVKDIELRAQIEDGMRKAKVDVAVGDGYEHLFRETIKFDWVPSAVLGMLTDRELDTLMPRKTDGSALRKLYEKDTVFEGRVKAAKALKISKSMGLMVRAVKSSA